MAHSHDRKQQVEQQLEQHVLPLAVERAIVLIGERGEQEARAQLAGETAWVVREQSGPFIPPELQPYAEPIVQTVAGRVVDRAMEQAIQRIRMPPAPAWSPQPPAVPPGGPPPGNVSARALDATPPPEPVHGWSPQPQQQPMSPPMPMQPPMQARLPPPMPMQMPPGPMPQRQAGGGKGLLIALLVVMVLGAGGFAVWFFGFRDAGTEEGEGQEDEVAAGEADEADEAAKADEKKDDVVAGGKTVAPAASGTEAAAAQAPVDAAAVAGEEIDAGVASTTPPPTTPTTPTATATTASAEEEPFVGSWTISSAKTLAGVAYTGKVVIAKQGDVYQVSWTTSGGGYQGIGLRAGVDQLYVAWGPGEVALGVYELRGTELTGRWAMPGGAALGTEKSAKEARKLAARHKTVGALPTGEAYKGELALKDKGATWDVSWYVETKKMEGIAIPGTGRELESDSFPIIGVAYGKGAGIVRYQMHGEGELRGVWSLPRQRALATEDLIR